MAKIQVGSKKFQEYYEQIAQKFVELENYVDKMDINVNNQCIEKLNKLIADFMPQGYSLVFPKLEEVEGDSIILTTDNYNFSFAVKDYLDKKNIALSGNMVNYSTVINLFFKELIKGFLTVNMIHGMLKHEEQEYRDATVYFISKSLYGDRNNSEEYAKYQKYQAFKEFSSLKDMESPLLSSLDSFMDSDEKWIYCFADSIKNKKDTVDFIDKKLLNENSDTPEETKNLINRIKTYKQNDSDLSALKQILTDKNYVDFWKNKQSLIENIKDPYDTKFLYELRDFIHVKYGKLEGQKAKQSILPDNIIDCFSQNDDFLKGFMEEFYVYTLCKEYVFKKTFLSQRSLFSYDPQNLNLMASQISSFIHAQTIEMFFNSAVVSGLVQSLWLSISENTGVRINLQKIFQSLCFDVYAKDNLRSKFIELYAMTQLPLLSLKSSFLKGAGFGFLTGLIFSVAAFIFFPPAGAFAFSMLVAYPLVCGVVGGGVEAGAGYAYNKEQVKKFSNELEKPLKDRGITEDSFKKDLNNVASSISSELTESSEESGNEENLGSTQIINEALHSKSDADQNEPLNDDAKQNSDPKPNSNQESEQSEQTNQPENTEQESMNDTTQDTPQENPTLHT